MIYVSISSGNFLAPKLAKSITGTWTNDDPVHGHIQYKYVILPVEELTFWK